MTERPCGAVRVCGRPYAHIGHHGGFRRRDQIPHLLPPREYEAVRRLALGQTWDVICADMGISRATLSKHLLNAKDRYNVPTNHALWMALGWLDVPGEPTVERRIA